MLPRGRVHLEAGERLGIGPSAGRRADRANVHMRTRKEGSDARRGELVFKAALTRPDDSAFDGSFLSCQAPRRGSRLPRGEPMSRRGDGIA